MGVHIQKFLKFLHLVFVMLAASRSVDQDKILSPMLPYRLGKLARSIDDLQRKPDDIRICFELLHSGDAIGVRRNERRTDSLLQHETRRNLRQRRRFSDPRRANQRNDPHTMTVQLDPLGALDDLPQIIKCSEGKIVCQSLPRAGTRCQILQYGLFHLLRTKRLLQGNNILRLVLAHDLRQKRFHLSKFILQLPDFFFF